MSKKTVVIVGGAGQLAAAVAHALTENPGALVTVEPSDKPTATLDPETHTIGINPDFYNGLSDRDLELYGIERNSYAALANDHKISNYTLHKSPSDLLSDLKIHPHDDLPENTTKPKFLMARDHHIRSPRGRR